MSEEKNDNTPSGATKSRRPVPKSAPPLGSRGPWVILLVVAAAFLAMRFMSDQRAPKLRELSQTEFREYLGDGTNTPVRVSDLERVRQVETGSTYDIFYNAKHPYTQALLRAVPRLDVEDDQQLESIEGTPPNMIAPPQGCAFSTRCKNCMKICQKMEPPSFEFEDGHTAQCWLYYSQVGAELAESTNTTFQE